MLRNIFILGVKYIFMLTTINCKALLPRGVNLKPTVTFKNRFNGKSPFAVNCSGNISLEETRNNV